MTMLKKIKLVFRSDRGVQFFLISLIMTGVGYGIYKGIIDNYLAEIVGIGEFDRGVMEFSVNCPAFCW